MTATPPVETSAPPKQRRQVFDDGRAALDEAAREMVKTGVGIKQAQREHPRGLLAILDKIRDRCVIEQLPEMLSFVWTEWAR